MSLYLNLKKDEKEKLTETWNILSDKFTKINYKPTESTDAQLDYIRDLSRFLDRKDAAVVITLLQILNTRKKELVQSPMHVKTSRENQE